MCVLLMCVLRSLVKSNHSAYRYHIDSPGVVWHTVALYPPVQYVSGTAHQPYCQSVALDTGCVVHNRQHGEPRIFLFVENVREALSTI